MSVPKKHHFLPEFYLRRWATDGKVWEYRRPRDEVTVKRVYPAQTGYVPELYAIQTHSDPLLRQRVEARFMAYVDNRAADALRCILGEKGKPDDPDLRDGWTRFLMSLIHRTPARVHAVRTAVRNRWDEIITDLVAKCRTSPRSDDEALDEAALRNDLSAAEETHAELLMSLIDSDVIGNALNSMLWGIGTLPSPRHGLLTGDAPVMMSNGLGGPKAFIIVPVGPDSFFIGANERRVIDAFGTQDPRSLEGAFNDAIASQADSLVIGATDRQKRFVENRLGMGLIGASSHMLPGVVTWAVP